MSSLYCSGLTTEQVGKIYEQFYGKHYSKSQVSRLLNTVHEDVNAWLGRKLDFRYVIRAWRTNWDELTSFFDFSIEIRKIIYTTNLIENLNGKIRKYTKNKLSFPNDDALKKSVYLSIMEIEKKWNQPIWNWGMIFNQFLTIFEDRIQV